MTALQLTALGLMAIFYTAYFTKMLFQRRKGVQTDQIGKGSKARAVLRIEKLMKLATYAIVPVELVSILWNFQIWETPALCWSGLVITTAGILIFILAMVTMRDSWRAGIPESDKTELVTTGIYRLSRNPAFLGFDLMYLGLLTAFFNPIHLVFVIFAVVMLHLQILQEEQFLTAVFEKEYLKYKKRTGRYFII
jgi:protein-S-isoprenylcysteine O-methyltransferase Ste14